LPCTLDQNINLVARGPNGLRVCGIYQPNSPDGSPKASPTKAEEEDDGDDPTFRALWNKQKQQEEEGVEEEEPRHPKRWKKGRR
jgi:hypothetical protein